VAAQDAIATYRELLDMQPNSLLALSALEGLYSRQQSWQQVQEVLTRRLKAVQSVRERVGVLRKLVALAHEKLRSTDDAIGYLQQWSELAPGDAEVEADLGGDLEIGAQAVLHHVGDRHPGPAGAHLDHGRRRAGAA